MTDAHSFDGTLLEVPFGSAAVESVAIKQFRELIESRDSEDVLVVTGTPTSMGTFRDVLAAECPGAAVPNVTSVIVHATEIINRTDDRGILSDAMQRELLQRFLTEQDWNHEYLQRAAEQESFTADLAHLLETATWQDAALDVTPELKEIAAVRDAFHTWLTEHGHLERSQMITEATGILEATENRESVLTFDAILALEFEEFTPSDRRYLQRIAEDRELVCIAEADASIGRTRIETGPITEHVSFSEHRTVTPTEPMTRPAAIASYFAAADTPPTPESGTVQILPAETGDEELQQIAAEIERLREQTGIEYEEIAVALKNSGDAVIDAMQAFEQAGIPTDSATVLGFGDDPAIRELLQVVIALADDTDLRREAVETIDEAALSADLQASLVEMEQLGDALRKWATDSELKQRIAAETAPLTARSQFGNIRQAFAIADFLEDTTFIDATWENLAEVLIRAHDHAPKQNQTSAIERDGGVRVDHIRAVKNGSFRVVFIPEVIDGQYPGQPSLSRLFPNERVTQMPDYPGVTQIEPADVAATFNTDSTASSRALRQYHTEHSRRLLAVGAASATERLYLSLHTHEDTALDERVQPSRFLTAAYRTVPWLTELTDSEINTERAAEEFLLSRVDRALADIRRATSQDVTVSLETIEDDFEEIQTLLANSGERGEKLQYALQARVDFAAGVIRRE